MARTELGRLLRKLRIEVDETLLDMGKRLEVSASYISAVEVGRKPPSDKFIRMLIERYDLSKTEEEELEGFANESRTMFRLQPKRDFAREAVGLFARRMNTLTREDFSKIVDVLRKKDKK